MRRTFEAYLSCGMPQAGFCRVRCGCCGFDRIVAFSCKLRGLCPSCAARRMADTAAHLVDRVLPTVRYRQWVLALPFSLRVMAARDPDLRTAVLRILLQRVFAWQRRRARELGVGDPRPAAVSFLHLFGSALNLHPHTHSLLPDGVFWRRGDRVEIVPLLAPTDDEVESICTQVAWRVRRLVEARLEQRLELADDGTASALVTPPMLQLSLIRRDEVDFEHPADRGRLCAAVEGFSLHAGVAVAAQDREGLERLCRYGLRPSFALERLSLLDDRVRYKLKRPWPGPGGVTELVMDPVDFLARLTALIPAPHVNMVRYLGAFAPASPLRRLVVPRQVEDEGCVHPQRHAASTSTGSSAATPRGAHTANQAVTRVRDADVGREASTKLELRYLCGAVPMDEETLAPIRSRRLDWAALLARVWALDVLECPRCRGRMRVIAALSERAVVARVLAHLDLPTTLPQPAPARAPPWLQEDLEQGAFEFEADLDQRAL